MPDTDIVFYEDIPHFFIMNSHASDESIKEYEMIKYNYCLTIYEEKNV